MENQGINNNSFSKNGLGVMPQLQQSAEKLGLGKRLNSDSAVANRNIASAQDTVRLSPEAMEQLRTMANASLTEVENLPSLRLPGGNGSANSPISTNQVRLQATPSEGEVLDIQAYQMQDVDLQVSIADASRQDAFADVRDRVDLTAAMNSISANPSNLANRSIADADMAAESATFTRAQVLQQASSAVLSQASSDRVASARMVGLLGGGGSVGAAVSEDGTATLRGFEITVGETQTDENGNVTGATGMIDLSSIGGGIVEAELEFYGGKVIGATATESTTVTVAGADVTMDVDVGFDGITLNAEGAQGDAFSQDVAAALNGAARSGSSSLNRAVTNLNELEASGSDQLQAYTTELGRAGAAGDVGGFFRATDGAGDGLGTVLNQMSRVGDGRVSDFLMAAGNNSVNQGDFLTQMAGVADEDVDSFVRATSISGSNAGEFLTQLQRVDPSQQSALMAEVAGAGGNAFRLVGQMSRVSDADLNTFVNVAGTAGNQGNFLRAMERVDDADVGAFISAASAAGDDVDRFARGVRHVLDEDVGNFVAAAENAGSRVGDFLDQAGRLTNYDTKSDFLSLAASTTGDQTGAMLTQMERVRNSGDLNNFVAAAESAQADGRLDSFLTDMSQVSDDDLVAYLDIAATEGAQFAGVINSGSVEVGGVTVNNLQTSTNDAGEAIVTGQVTLPGGMGTANVQLDIQDGEVVGAFTTDDTLSFNVAGNTLTMNAAPGENLITLGSDGSFSFAGSVTAKVGDQNVTIQDADFAFGTDETGSEYIRVGGTYGLSDAAASAAVEFNKNGTVSAEMGFDAELFGGALPGLDKVTGFLEKIGVGIDTSETASISYNSQTKAFAFDVAGISGSYNSTTNEFSVGGLSAGAGISLGLDNLTINGTTGYVSGSVSAGVGVGAGGLGVDISLANFSFEYDPSNNDAITLTGSVGVAGANLSATVKLGRGTDGKYGVDSISFAANFDPAIAEAARALGNDVAAGLTNAYSQGAALGNQAISDLGTFTGDNLNNFAKGLSNAGTDVSSFLGKTGELVGDDLNNFLTSAGKAGDQLGTLISALDAPDMNDVSSFLQQTASMDNLQSELGKGLDSFKNGLGDLFGFLPALPDISLPDIKLPDLQLPDIEIPKIKIPKLF